MASDQHALHIPSETRAVAWAAERENDLTSPVWTSVAMAGLLTLLAIEAAGAWYVVAAWS